MSTSRTQQVETGGGECGWGGGGVEPFQTRKVQRATLEVRAHDVLGRQGIEWNWSKMSMGNM